MSFEFLQIDQEVARLKRSALRDKEEARAALAALLSRPANLRGEEKRLALDFNARLVTKLREQGVYLFGVEQ